MAVGDEESPIQAMFRIGDEMLAARYQLIVELEHREQQAWLAAWDAEYRAQFAMLDGRIAASLDAWSVLWADAKRIAAQDALLRRAERVEAAARNVLAAADLCDYWYEADIAPLREALEGGK